MKRNYVAPTAEKVTFNYSEQVVAASGNTCGNIYSNSGSHCEEVQTNRSIYG
jgi:hypothetical protein